jgi:hypothetical protein
MSYTSAVHPQPTPLPHAWALLLRAALALATGAALFLGMLAALIVGYDLYHAGRIYSGVSLAGVDLSGFTPE